MSDRLDELFLKFLDLYEQRRSLQDQVAAEMKQVVFFSPSLISRASLSSLEPGSRLVKHASLLLSIRVR
jgi:hypothetical protein